MMDKSVPNQLFMGCPISHLFAVLSSVPDATDLEVLKVENVQIPVVIYKFGT